MRRGGHRACTSPRLDRATPRTPCSARAPRPLERRPSSPGTKGRVPAGVENRIPIACMKSSAKTLPAMGHVTFFGRAGRTAQEKDDYTGSSTRTTASIPTRIKQQDSRRRRVEIKKNVNTRQKSDTTEKHEGAMQSKCRVVQLLYKKPHSALCCCCSCCRCSSPRRQDGKQPPPAPAKTQSRSLGTSQRV